MKKSPIQNLFTDKETYAMVFKGGEAFVRRTITTKKNNKMFDFVKL